MSRPLHERTNFPASDPLHISLITRVKAHISFSYFNGTNNTNPKRSPAKRASARTTLHLCAARFDLITVCFSHISPSLTFALPSITYLFTIPPQQQNSNARRSFTFACVALMATTAAAFEVISGSGVVPAAELPPAPLANSEESIFNTASMAAFHRQLSDAFLSVPASVWSPEQLAALADGISSVPDVSPPDGRLKEVGDQQTTADNISFTSPVHHLAGGVQTALAAASISTAFLNRVLREVTRVINAVGTSLVIPATNEGKFGFDTIRFAQFKVGGISVATGAPNIVVIIVQDITIGIGSTRFWIKAIGRCNGVLHATVEGATIQVVLSLGNDGKGHLRANTGVAALIRRVVIAHKFDNFLCKVANALISLFIGNIVKKISGLIQTKMPLLLGPAISQAVDKMFLNIPLYFVNTPSVVPQGFSVTVDLLGTVKAFYTDANGRVPADPMAATENGLQAYERDIAIFVPAASLNSIASVAFDQGKFGWLGYLNGNTSLFRAVMPNAYAACPSCRLVLRVSFGVPPRVIFDSNNAHAIGHDIAFAFSALRPNGSTCPLFVMGASMHVSLNGLVIRTVKKGGANNAHFQLRMNSLTLAKKATSVGPLPASTSSPRRHILRSVPFYSCLQRAVCWV